ncbi:MAG: ATP cone domain-containing protein [Planctomycetota bacterium]
MELISVRRRDGTAAPFDRERITRAIAAAQRAVGEPDADLSLELTEAVCDYLERNGSEPLDIEDVQDAVVIVLQGSTNYGLAQSYIRYRDQRERERRQRRAQNRVEPDRINLHVLTTKGARRPWQRARLERFLTRDLALSQKHASEVACRVESFLAETNVDEISTALLMSLVDTALVQVGCHADAERRAPLRISKVVVDRLLYGDDGRLEPVQAGGHALMRQWSMQSGYGKDVLRLFARGRIWLDGLDDPLRGSHYAQTMDGRDDPWRLLAEAFAQVAERRRYWQRIDLILPPLILGCLERGDDELGRALDTLARDANCYLYCDGRTPLLDSWPLATKQVGIATYADDFLLQGRLQELGLSMLTGPHLMQPGYRRRIAVRLAVNAQGLDEDYSKMDLLAMAVVSAARTRLQQLSVNPEAAGTEVRYVIFGLPPNSAPLEYLERQVTQEGLRCGVPLSRSTSLPQRACEHFGRALREGLS